MTNEEKITEITELINKLIQKREELAIIISTSQNEMLEKTVEFDSTVYKIRNEFYQKKAEIKEFIKELKYENDELNNLIKKSIQLLPKSDFTVQEYISKQQAREKIQNEFTNRSVGLNKILETENYCIGSYNLNTKSKMLTKAGSSVRLTNKELYLLATFAANINSLIPRKYLLETIWENESYFAGRSMDVYLCKLRKLMQEDNTINFINVHGVGYKLLFNE